MPHPTDDLRIRRLDPLVTPEEVIREAPAHASIATTVTSARDAIHRILGGEDDRLVVVIGPCSIHDPEAARDYAARLAQERQRHREDLEILMRVYFEKPRTTVGWKGLINDPGLDGGFRIDEGLRIARRLLLDITALGLPAACEFLDVTTPQYIADLVAWGAIGARTTESQIHREMASGLSCPVGFKNSTMGDVKVAVEAVLAARQPHHFLAICKDGRAGIASTTGNGDGHIVLRGGRTPNYRHADVAAAAAELSGAELPEVVMIDASHANSGKDYRNQPKVLADICDQVGAGEHRIIGTMIESNLVAGRQNLVAGVPLVYGQSITDGCVDWATSTEVLGQLAAAVRARRHTRTTRAASQQPGASVTSAAGG
jgi:3-deoxy-7-phosphoheptulonate synthase